MEGKGYGIYQVYGDHIVFGPDSLLYVGLASKQTLSSRLEQHLKGWLSEERGISIYLGRLHEEDYGGGKSWEMLLEEAEALTIYWHTPPYNSKNINSYGGRPLCVQNLGDRGRLLPEYTSLYEHSREME